MVTWNGVSLFWKHRKNVPDITVWSDAAGSSGCGALTTTAWFQHPWPADVHPRSIACLELTPIVMAAFVWGKNWEGKIVMFMCDNEGVVHVLNKLYSRDQDLSQLLKCLVFVAARFNFWFSAMHIEGRNNTGADYISRNKSGLFLAQAPEPMQVTPSTRIPEEIPEILYRQQPDWLSPVWTDLFKACCRSSCIYKKSVPVRQETIYQFLQRI